MQIRILQKDLFSAVQDVQNIVMGKTTLPILSNLLIETVENGIKVIGTDLDIGISSFAPAVILEEGSITIPAKRFFEIIRELPSNEIVLSTLKNNNVTIETERCFFKIMGLPKDEFPNIPEVSWDDYISMNALDFKHLLIKTSFSMSHDENRYILNGLYFKIEGNVIYIVGTDGRRLSLVEKEIDTNLRISAIVPSKTIMELNRILKSSGQEIKIVFKENQIIFSVGYTLIISRVIEGDYPDYQKVIPAPIKDKIRVNTQDLLIALRRAALLTTIESQAVKIDIFKDKMIIFKDSPSVGEVKQEIDISYSGREISVCFNPNYIIDVLKVLEDEEIEIEIFDVEKPAIIRKEKNYLYLVLPMRMG